MIDYDLEKISQAKRETQQLENILRRDMDNIKLADKLHGCCQFLEIKQKPNGTLSIIPNFPCGVPFFQLCLYFKARRERGKSFGIFQKITNDPLLKNPLFFLLTLTVPEVNIYQFKEELKLMKSAYKELTQHEKWGKMIIGSSNYLHVGLNDYGLVRPHWHVILITKPSFRTKYRITEDEWANMWKEALDCDYEPHVNCKELGKRGKAEAFDFINASAYGLNAIKFEHILKYPGTFLQLMPLLKYQQKRSHQGIIREKHIQVVKEFRENKQVQLPNQPNQAVIFRFAGNTYQQYRNIVV